MQLNLKTLVFQETKKKLPLIPDKIKNEFEKKKRLILVTLGLKIVTQERCLFINISNQTQRLCWSFPAKQLSTFPANNLQNAESCI